MPEATTITYPAFLSYSHKDNRWAQWLHKRLEDFALGADLIGRETELGPVPKLLRPIFRDRDEFTPGQSLTDATIAALDASRALIVLCSPSAAKSHYVNEEVRLFRWRHPERPVVPVIVGGNEAEGFPPALRFEIDPETGAVTDRPITLLGSDLRADHDGKSLGLAKSDPNNAGWQADLAASHGMLGQLMVQTGQKNEALKLFRAGRAIVAPLARQSCHRVWLGYLSAFDREIAALEN